MSRFLPVSGAGGGGIRAIVITLILLTGAGMEEAQSGGTPAHLLRLVATIPLPGVNGRIDHLAFDPGRQRLFVAALGNNSLEIVDLRTLAWSHRIGGLQEPQGVVYLPGSDEIAVSCGGDGTCSFFSAESLTRVGEIKIGEDADNIRYLASSNQLIVGFGSGGLALVDPRKRSIVATVKLPGHPESFQIDRAGRRAFVNVPDVKKVMVIDLRAHSIVGEWAVPAQSNYPMALDSLETTLYVACRSPALLVAYDAQTGTIRSREPIGGDADDVFVDSQGRRLYVACGAGEVDVFRLDRTGKPTREGAVPTVKGARTCLFVSERHQLFVAVRRSESAEASILVFDLSDS